MKYIAYARAYSDNELKEMNIKLLKYAESNGINYSGNKVYNERYRAIKSDGSHKQTLNMLKNMILEFTGMDDEGLYFIIPELTCLGNNNSEIIEELEWFRENNIQIMALDIEMLIESRNLSMMYKCIIDVLIDTLKSLNKRDDKRVKHVRMEGMNSRLKCEDHWGRPKALDKDSFNKVYDKVREGEITPSKAIELLQTNKGTYYRYKIERDRELGLRE